MTVDAAVAGGLSSVEAAQRLAVDGPNVLPVPWRSLAFADRTIPNRAGAPVALAAWPTVPAVDTVGTVDKRRCRRHRSRPAIPPTPARTPLR